MVKFGLELLPDTEVKTLVELSVLAENGGFDNIWVTDHYNNRNPYISLSAIALATKRITIGPGITNPYVINPAWTASAIATLDEVSGGRAALGIGAGDKVTLTALGIPMGSPIAAVGEMIEAVRRLWAGENVTMRGQFLNLNGAALRYKPGRRIPIYMGAQGPRMLEMAGRVGDGVLINASHPKDFTFATQQIRKGAEAAGRDPAPIDVVACTSFSVDYEAEKARSKAIPVVAFIASGSPAEVLKRHGINAEDAARVGEALSKGRFEEAFGHVTKSMVDAFSIYGTPQDCVKRVKELVRIGVTQFVVGSPVGPKRRASLDLISKEVIPPLK